MVKVYRLSACRPTAGRAKICARLAAACLCAAGCRSIHTAAREGDEKAVARLLLAHGAAVDARGIGEATPLAAAVAGGQTNMVAFLLKAGADVNATASYGRTPLGLAAERNDVAIGRLLLDWGANPSHGDGASKVWPRSEAFRALLESGPQPKRDDSP